MAAVSAPDEHRIRLIAHSLWIEEGMPEGRAESHWLRAVDIVTREAQESAAPAEGAAALPKPKRKSAAASRKPSPRKRG